MSKKNDLILSMLVATFLLLDVLFVLSDCRVYIANNSAKYLHQASHFLRTGDMEIILGGVALRGPLFPGLIAIFFKLFGVGVPSALLISKLSFWGSLVVSYLFVKRLYGLWAALLVLVLLLSSGRFLTLATTIDTDIVLPFFLLLFLLLYYLSISMPSRLLAILSGVTLGLGVMVKESALVYLILPIIMLFLNYFGERRIRINSFFYLLGGFVVCIAPWAISVALKYGDPTMILGQASPAYQKFYAIKTQSDPLNNWIKLFTVDFFPSLLLYYREHLRVVTTLAPLFVFSWGVVCFRAFWRRRKEDFFILMAALCYLPIILHVSAFHYRVGQTVIVFYLSYFVLAISALRILDYISNRNVIRHLKYLHKIKWGCVFVVGVIFVFTQVSPIVKRHGVGDIVSLLLQEKNQVMGRYTNDQKQAMAWLEENVNCTTNTIIADGFTNEALEFFSKKAIRIPTLNVNPVLYHAYGSKMDINSIENNQHSNKLLFLSTYIRFRENRSNIYFFFEDHLLGGLRESAPNYIVISGRSLFLEKYFNVAPWAYLSYKNDTVRIFKIDSEKLASVETAELCINEHFIDDLGWLEKQHPDNFALLRSGLDQFGLSIEELKNVQCLIPHGESY